MRSLIASVIFAARLRRATAFIPDEPSHVAPSVISRLGMALNARLTRAFDVIERELLWQRRGTRHI